MTKPVNRPYRKPGPEPKRLDPKQVEGMAALMCTVGEIAAVLGTTPSQIERLYGAAVETGRERAKASLRRMQFQKAKQESEDPRARATMLVWLGKQYLAQSDQLTIDDKATTAQAHAEAIRKAREERKLEIVKLAAEQAGIPADDAPPN